MPCLAHRPPSPNKHPLPVARAATRTVLRAQPAQLPPLPPRVHLELVHLWGQGGRVGKAGGPKEL